jgi:hypothetical protein
MIQVSGEIPLFSQKRVAKFRPVLFFFFFVGGESVAIRLSIGYTFKWSCTKPSPVEVEICLGRLATAVTLQNWGKKKTPSFLMMRPKIAPPWNL